MTAQEQAMLFSVLSKVIQSAKTAFESKRFDEAYKYYVQVMHASKNVLESPQGKPLLPWFNGSFKFAVESACYIPDNHYYLTFLEKFHNSFSTQLQNDPIIKLFYAKICLRLGEHAAVIKILGDVNCDVYNKDIHSILEHGDILSQAYLATKNLKNAETLWEQLKVLISTYTDDQSKNEPVCIALIEISHYLHDIYLLEENITKATQVLENSQNIFQAYCTKATPSKIASQAYLTNMYYLLNAYLNADNDTKAINLVLDGHFNKAALQVDDTTRERILLSWLNVVKEVLKTDVNSALKVNIALFNFLEKNKLTSRFGNMICMSCLLMSRMYLKRAEPQAELLIQYCRLSQKYLDKIENFEIKSVVDFKNKLHQIVGYGLLEKKEEQNKIIEELYAHLSKVPDSNHEQYNKEFKALQELLPKRPKNVEVSYATKIKTDLLKKQIALTLHDSLLLFIESNTNELNNVVSTPSAPSIDAAPDASNIVDTDVDVLSRQFSSVLYLKEHQEKASNQYDSELDNACLAPINLELQQKEASTNDERSSDSNYYMRPITPRCVI